MTAMLSDASYPWLNWSRVSGMIDQMWDPENTPHHSIVGLTGAGKSYLTCKGILPLCEWDRVLIVDTKEDDPLVREAAKGVRELPRRTWYTTLQSKEKPREHWYRLVVHDDREQARKQVHTALSRVYSEGDWVVYFDEIRDITDPRDPGLGLLPWVDHIYRKGRYKRISILAATQAPRYVPTSFYDQASFAWIGRIRDRERQKRLLEIGGLDRQDLPIVSSLKRREWLLAADNGEYFARTKVTS